MGGQIGLESEPGKGSTFWFSLPLTTAVPEPASSTPPPDLQAVRVLIVDDLEINRRVLASQLRVWKLDFECASSGAEALEKLRTAHAEGRAFRILLMDFLMPEMDGEEAGRIIKADRELQDTALILISSANQRGNTARFREAGFAACLVKPLARPAILLEAMGRAMANSRETEVVRRLSSMSITSAPLQPPANDPLPAARPSSTIQKVRSTARLLLAEDNPVNQLLARGILKSLGYSVDVADDGTRALAMVQENAYDLIFMDCQMPNMDGFETSAAIRASEPEGRRTPIIALTANAMAGDRERCLNAGMDDYLTKPLRSEPLALALDRWLTPHGKVISYA
jgi:CheY-like chemotaxis protein